jgi:hypothetical protein
MYKRTGKKWTGSTMCGKFTPNEKWGFDRNEEYQQLLALFDTHETPVTYETVYNALGVSVVYLKEKGFRRTKALHLGMQLGLQLLLDELVREDYISCEEITPVY